MPATSPTQRPDTEPAPAPGGFALGTPVPRHDSFADGSLKASGFELDGKLHGHWEWFRSDRTLMRSGEFYLGEQVGTWRTWDRRGHLVKETVFTRAPTSAAAGTTAAKTAAAAAETDPR
ncbi:toxin-antitoxin system YwqK family antitoxin [Cryobacterium sp. AP23]